MVRDPHVCSRDFHAEYSGSPPNVGDLSNFSSAIFFGIHTLRTKHISRTVGKEKFSALLGYEVGVVAVLSTIWCLVAANFNHIQDSERIPWTWELFSDWIFAFPWVPALYTGVFSTGIRLWGEIAAMREVSATETTVIYGLGCRICMVSAWRKVGSCYIYISKTELSILLKKT